MSREVKVHFEHGLGDTANFAHLVALTVRRGWRVGVSGPADKAPLFKAAGAEYIGDRGGAHHPWLHPVVHPSDRIDTPWEGNKPGHNVGRPPMPRIGGAGDLWADLCGVRLSLEDQVTPAARAAADRLLAGLPRPVVLFHTTGNTSPECKNYGAAETLELYRHVLDRTPGSVVVLDWDNRSPRFKGFRCRHLGDDFRGLSVVELYHLMTRADLFVGIDSGPLHLLRFTDTPGLGLWPRNYVSHFALPRERTLNVVAGCHRDGDTYRRAAYNTIASPGDGIDPAFAGEQLVRLLGEPRYLAGRESIARDVQLRHFVSLTRGGTHHGAAVDRHLSFDLALTHLRAAENPTIVETGTIRAREDWPGAGFSTYLLGAYLAARGAGQLHTVDLSAESCRFAAAWTEQFGRVAVHRRHSHEFLREFARPIDLLYADSCDVDVPGHQSCCLEECRLAQPNLGPGAMILIDDTWHAGGKWHGKGGLAVPWLTANGWDLIYSGYQAVLRRAGAVTAGRPGAEA